MRTNDNQIKAIFPRLKKKNLKNWIFFFKLHLQPKTRIDILSALVKEMLTRLEHYVKVFTDKNMFLGVPN